MWEPRRLTTLWASTAWYRDSFTSVTPNNAKSIRLTSRGLKITHTNIIIVDASRTRVTVGWRHDDGMEESYSRATLAAWVTSALVVDPKCF
jgi:hypothetical protein